MSEIRIASLCVVLAFLATPAAAATKIVLEGDAAPGGNGTFTGFSLRTHVTETGKVFFFGSTDATVPPGATRAGCTFRYDIDGSNGTALLCNGGAVGLPGADTWIEVDQKQSLDVNGAGALVFTGVYRDTMGNDRWSTFHLSAAAVLTDLGYADGDPQINEADDVIIGGLDLHITSPGEPVTTILIEDQALPDDPTLFATDSFAAVGPSGEVAVAVRATPAPEGPPYTLVMYLWESGVFTRIGTTTFGPLTAQGFDKVNPHFTPGGRLLASVDDGFFTDGFVEWDGVAWRGVVTARPDELIGAMADTAGLSRIAFMSLEPGIIGPASMVVGTAPLARNRFLQSGDVLPEGTVSQTGAAAISTTHWAVWVRLDDTNGPEGIYVVRANMVPSLLAPAGVLLATLLALGGARRLRR